jgi:hypothetical protein
MHNLMSFNQLAGWNSSLDNVKLSLERSNQESDVINDYYDCLIECQDDQSTCKRICRKILSQDPEE